MREHANVAASGLADEQPVELLEQKALHRIQPLKHFVGERSVQHEVRHHPEVAVVFDHVLQKLLCHFFNVAFGIFIDELFQEKNDLLRATQKRLDEERPLVGEVAVDERVRDAGLAGDVADAHLVERLAGKHALGRGDDDVAAHLALPGFE